jgi:hypothetical protein
MRQLIFTLLVFISSNSLFSQTRKMLFAFDIKLKVDTVRTRLYSFKRETDTSVKTVVLQMKYGESTIVKATNALDLKKSGCNILSVDLVYTDYNGYEKQKRLNTKRITDLYFDFPELFEQSLTKWRFVEQLGYATEEGAKTLFHGVVIKYTLVPPYIPASIHSMLSDLKKEKLSDTSLFRIFRKYPKYFEEQICIDFTGSMSPYYFQVFVWMKLKESKKTMNFTLFNDGDAKSTDSKHIGSTGGIYFCSSNSIDTVIKTAFTCISNGSGGDSPENDIEAVLSSLKKFPETKEIILIADNWSDMRDYSLLKNINKPVRVILCGTNRRGVSCAINAQYLNLAYVTKGSIHTIEQDIDDLSRSKEGDIITIGASKFVFMSGRFYQKR